MLTKLFFVLSVGAYILFLFDRANSFALHDYRVDAVILPLLGILGYFAFDKPKEDRLIN